MERVKHTATRLPGLGAIVRRSRPFAGSREYWEQRYAKGGTSGAGSYGRLAEWKAAVLNDFVAQHDVTSVIELGCGDGSQLALARYPSYLGLDVSATTLARCVRRFANDPTKSFVLSDPATFGDPAQFLRAELALSLDVVYHLVEDDVYERYMTMLFGAARRFVIVYSSDHDEAPNGHVRHRQFSSWVESQATGWRRTAVHANPYPYDPAHRDDTSFADFHVFTRV